MSQSRATILGRVRESLRAPGPPEPPAPVPVPGLPAPPAEASDLVGRFSAEATASGCAVHGPVSATQTPELLVSLLRESHAHQLLVWGGEELPLPDVGASLAARGFQVIDPALPADAAGRRAQLSRLDEADVGVTGAIAGLADTGTLVLASGARRPRLSWLLPPIHIALLATNRIVPGLPELLTGAAPRVVASANVALVTGPSRTGDIELILTRGVHGPGAVHVVLVND